MQLDVAVLCSSGGMSDDRQACLLSSRAHRHTTFSRLQRLRRRTSSFNKVGWSLLGAFLGVLHDHLVRAIGRGSSL